jgi:hypothetical protein
MKKTFFLSLAMSLLFFCNAHSQSPTINEVLKSLQLPDGWTATVENSNSFYNEFNRKSIAGVTFMSSGASVCYTIFQYNKADSSVFKQGWFNYIIQANCEFKPGNDPSSELATFVKNDFYFLLQLCPCRTDKHPECGVLARRLTEWARTK